MGLLFSDPPNILSSPKQNGENPPWAFITGATSGIGRDIAEELARRGFHIIIHGRRADALESLSKSLSESYACEVRIFCFDATETFTSNPSDWNALAAFNDLNLRLLVNNAGFGHNPDGFGPFSETTPTEIAALITANTGFTTRLTHEMLPTLRRTASPDSPSLIINAGSLADAGLPYVSVYSGTKAYIRAFSNSLDTELMSENANVRVVASIIGDTDSDGHRVGVSLFTPDSKSMARSILDTASKSSGGAVSPSWGHWLQEWLVWVQPYPLRRMGFIAHFRTLLKKKA